MSEELIKRLRDESENIGWSPKMLAIAALLDEAADALSRPAPAAVPVGDGWQPIETAPKQGWVEVLVRGDSGCAVAYFDPDEGEWLSDYRGKGNWQYVHALWWHPLPPAPAAKKEQEHE